MVLAVLFGRQPFYDFLQCFDVFFGCLKTRQVQFREELWQSRMLDISRCLQRNTLSECRTTSRKALATTSFRRSLGRYTTFNSSYSLLFSSSVLASLLSCNPIIMIRLHVVILMWNRWKKTLFLKLIENVQSREASYQFNICDIFLWRNRNLQKNEFKRIFLDDIILVKNNHNLPRNFISFFICHT